MAEECTSENLPEGISKICTKPGPEDLVPHLSGGRASLIISSTDRREKNAEGFLRRYYPDTDTFEDLVRHGDGKVVTRFKPHGIDLVAGEDGVERLYVVSHPTKKVADILIYRLDKNTLHFESRPSEYDSQRTLQSANDIAATPGGEIYVTNLRDKSVAHFVPDELGGGDWDELSTKKLRYPNGLILRDGSLFVAGASGGKIIRMDLVGSSGQEEVAKFKGGLDNFSRFSEYAESGDVSVTSHANLFRFLLHSFSARFRSPTRVFSLSLDRPEALYEIIPASGGEFPISGGSVAVVLDGDLYIGQAFGSYVLKAEAGAWKKVPFER